MAFHFVALIFSICSFILLLIANLGTTFDSTFLPQIYLVKIDESITGRSIRFGVYNSCLYYNATTTPHSCTTKMPAYSFDAEQFAEFCGADMSNSTMVKTYTDVVSKTNLTTFRGIVLIMPAVILIFISLCCTFLIRSFQRNNIIPFIGTFSSLFGFFAGAAGLALSIVTFWKGLDILERRIVGISHQWGPTIYLVGIGSGCILIALVCFVINLFSYKSDKRETLHLYDYDSNNNDVAATNNNIIYDTVHVSPPTTKQDDYDYEYYHAVSSPTTQNYPTYHQQQSYPQYHQNNNNYY
ncbi:MAG: hypothetical protein EXX96DRAFT_40138 [Benjaminiella poitrasii]|nr:MAG: hypothetical protein EXX96DRAFT_40138 [Benjaminiella poitrasii]